ncbi:SH3 domain [Dillenia turbinata]|uniref:SH3 domain n=1 Tax=Dillenia turbinata TaxID=194707 RepID=A0AAN8ZBY8_9MAGN
MEAIRKQASKLREQVAKQQQAVLRQLGHLGGQDVLVDEAELECHQQLKNLYTSTRAAKHFQKDIVRGVESFRSTSTKQMEIVRRLADDCCKYGNENESASSPLARASLQFGTSHGSMEKEREALLRILGDQVSEPLRALVSGAPLEDARLLTHRYNRLRQEVEAQAADVLRRQLKRTDPSTPAESVIKLQHAEAKLNELKLTLSALGREATAAMLSVEDQQQRTTFQRLVTMVDAERSYHRTVVDILEMLHAEMVLEEQLSESSSQSTAIKGDIYVPSNTVDTNSCECEKNEHQSGNDMSFIARAIHPFDAQADGELSLEVGDYIVVRQVAPHGWTEGECKGKTGWFPSAYVEREEKAPASNSNSM